MKPNKKIARYILKHGYEIKNYQQLCKILREDSTTGEAKTNQLRRWSLYFAYDRAGQKYYITDVYDDETVQENERLYKEGKDITAIYGRSRYRKELIPTLLYLLSNSPNGLLIETKMSLATSCGFFNEYAKDNR